jgi:CRP-like cAMP-binding protein
MATGYAHSRLITRLQTIAGLSESDARQIAKLPIALRNCGAGQELVRQGQTLDQCCLLVDGFLIRHKAAPDSTRQIVSWHVPGDIPDLYSLHLNRMDHSITALGPAVVGFIPHGAMLEALARSQSLTHILWRETLVDAAAFREWVVNIGRRDAIGRVAHTLCEVATRLRVVGLLKDDKFAFPASQTDIADATGMTTVHANRIIQQMRQQQLVEWNNPLVRILDWPRLVTTADFHEDYLHLRGDRQPLAGDPTSLDPG